MKTPQKPDDLGPDDRENFEERLAIMIHHGGLPLSLAYREAFARVVPREPEQVELF